MFTRPRAVAAKKDPVKPIDDEEEEKKMDVSGDDNLVDVDFTVSDQEEEEDVIKLDEEEEEDSKEEQETEEKTEKTAEDTKKEDKEEKETNNAAGLLNSEKLISFEKSFFFSEKICIDHSPDTENIVL